MGPWLPPGVGVGVAGLNIVGGLLYVGAGLPSVSGQTVEPALIDPRLPVDLRRPDWTGQGLRYWPSYASIPPDSRAAYLSWLADGRRYPHVPIGYVFLYFYGLERRALHDLRLDRSTVGRELSIIQAEVRRLLRIYGENSSFRSYAGEFDQVLDLLILAGQDTRPSAGHPPEPSREVTPLRLTVGLGSSRRRDDQSPPSGRWPGSAPTPTTTRVLRRRAAPLSSMRCSGRGTPRVIVPGWWSGLDARKSPLITGPPVPASAGTPG
ncbi:hypothetical protein GCM10027612_41240 [Microbispora bryophytorum subsp. camponoti]